MKEEKIMYIEQLEYIVEVAKTGSISNAAENLHVSPAGISKSIMNLEEKLGLKIFIRSRSGTIPTEAGKQIIKIAYEIVIKLQQIEEVAKAEKAVINEDFKLSASPSLFLNVLPQTLSAFKKDHAKVKIQISEKPSPDIIEDIIENKIDIGLIASNRNRWIQMVQKNKDLQFESLLETKINVYVSKHSPLAFSESVTPEELLDQSLVIYAGGYSKSFVNDFFTKYGAMNILFESYNTEVIKKTVALGLAIYFSNDLAAKNDYYVKNGDIVPIPLADNDNNNESISFGWIRSKKNPISNSAREFIKHLKFQIANSNY